MKKLEISKLMNGYVDEELQPKEGLVDRERVKELVRARGCRRRVQKRRVLLVLDKYK